MGLKKTKSNIILRIVVIFSICISSICSVCATENKMTKSYYEDVVLSFIYTFDKCVDDVKFNKYINDIEDEESYVLLDVGESGYAVVAKDSDMILEIRYQLPDNDIKTKDIYIGAGTFIDKQELKEIKLDEKSQDKLSALKNKNKQIKQEKSKKFKYNSISRDTSGSVVLNKPLQLSGGTEIGISDSRMTLYQGNAWRNDSQYSSDGICGSIATATMVTYHDIYVSSSYINQPYGCTTDNHARWIINHFKEYCEVLSNGGSTPYSVANGITRALYALNNQSSVVGHQTSSESTIKNKIGVNRPVVLELPSIKPNPYGAHMVCAYKYVDYDGYLWYKASDNWGNLAWINRNWVGQCIYIN